MPETGRKGAVMTDDKVFTQPQGDSLPPDNIPTFTEEQAAAALEEEAK